MSLRLCIVAFSRGATPVLQQKAAPVFTVFADDACAAASAGDGEGHKRKGLVFFLELYFFMLFASSNAVLFFE